MAEPRQVASRHAVCFGSWTSEQGVLAPTTDAEEWAVTKPRERIPGKCYAVTRRTHDGLFRLRPDEVVNNAIGYVVAVGCERYGVRCLAFCAMSNHYHGCFFDPDGRMADWECFVNGTLACVFNALHERSGYCWSAQEGNAIEVSGAALIEQIAYGLANPTKAGLVYSPAAWPGVSTDPRDLGRARGRTSRRPDVYFDPEGPFPEEARLLHATPEGWEPEEFRRQVIAELEAQLGRHRAEVKASGRGWLGAPAVLARSPLSAPARPLPAKVGRAAEVRPRLMGGTEEETRAMILRRVAFLERYALALAAWRDGVRAMLFPEGTWRVWRSFGARRGPPGTLGERCAFGPAGFGAEFTFAPS